MPSEIDISVAPRNGRAPRLVLATAGAVEHRDMFNTDNAKERRRFVRELAGKLGVDAKALATIDDRLVKAADEADATAEQIAIEQRDKRAGAVGTRPTDSGEPPSLLTDQGRTETANAKRFVARHGESVRYCPTWNEWLAYSGRHWRRDDVLEIETRAKGVVDAIWREVIQHVAANRELAAVLIRFATASGSAKGINAMLALARSELPIRPAELDSDLWALNCLNGTIDLRTGQLRPHNREEFLTKLCPVEYDPAATCPLWEKFLDSIMDGKADLIEFLQRAIGYSLTGVVREHMLMFLHGTGANGKSLLLGTIQEMLGSDYAMKAVPELLMAKRTQTHPTELADLHGKRFVACIEAEDGRRLAESLVKEMTGGDVIKARHLYEDFWEFKPQHTVWLAANHKPTIRGTDEGIWRRIKLVPFAVRFWDPDAGQSGPDELRQDKALGEKLKAEFPGILAWAVRGCLDWLANGLREPADVLAATAEYRGHEDVIGQFVEEVCLLGPQYRSSAEHLYQSYKIWCHVNGEIELSARKFGTKLVERGFQRYRNNGIWYRGIASTDHRWGATVVEPTEPTEPTEAFS